MLKRWWIAAGLLLVASLSGCKKSEGTKIKNVFGAPPQVSEVSLTKERKNGDCIAPALELCCVDPPTCSCCCSPDTVNENKISIDLVTASAKVTDATPPTSSHPTDILVVVLRFLIPPPGTSAPGTQVQQYSLEMFDNGTAPVSSQTLPTVPPEDVNILSGDLAAGDGIYTRKFYFGTNTSQGAASCLEETDKSTIGHTYSNFGASIDIGTSTLMFQFAVQAVDFSGNIDTSSDFPLPIQGTFRETTSLGTRPCGAPSGNGGCFPGP